MITTTSDKPSSITTRLLSVIHTFSPNLVSQSKVVFNRLTNLQEGITSRGLVPTMYPNATGAVSIGADLIGVPRIQAVHTGRRRRIRRTAEPAAILSRT